MAFISYLASRQNCFLSDAITVIRKNFGFGKKRNQAIDQDLNKPGFGLKKQCTETNQFIAQYTSNQILLNQLSKLWFPKNSKKGFRRKNLAINLDD